MKSHDQLQFTILGLLVKWTRCHTLSPYSSEVFVMMTVRNSEAIENYGHTSQIYWILADCTPPLEYNFYPQRGQPRHIIPYHYITF
jgi:hypothetical protein